MDKTTYEKYGELIIKIGVNLKQGQNLLINTSPSTWEYARALAKAAYKAGAKFVNIRANDPMITRYRVTEGSADNLGYLPNYVLTESYEYLANDWARIRIESSDDKGVMDGVDADKLDIVNRSLRSTLRRQQESLMRDDHAWTVTCAPSEQWAHWIAKTNNQDEKGALERLETVFKKVMRLDQEDPIKAWHAHIESISRRGKLLNDLDLASLEIVGPGTNLSVALCKTAYWRGGTDASTPDGRSFGANMPTEEVYTTPNFKETNGRVSVVRPVTVMDTLVKDAWFEFKQGKVVDFGASEGKEILQKFLNADEGASYLGEIALVDTTSPIYQSGLIFGAILLDENASCHFALGAGYPSCLRDSKQLSGSEAVKNAGCNVSMVHTDFMFGNESTDVFGVTKTGKKVKIIEKGLFVI